MKLKVSILRFCFANTSCVITIRKYHPCPPFDQTVHTRFPPQWPGIPVTAFCLEPGLAWMAMVMQPLGSTATGPEGGTGLSASLLWLLP